MLDEFIHLILPSIIAIIELIGIFVVAVSAVQGFYYYLRGCLGIKIITSSWIWPTAWQPVWSLKSHQKS